MYLHGLCLCDIKMSLIWNLCDKHAEKKRNLEGMQIFFTASYNIQKDEVKLTENDSLQSMTVLFILGGGGVVVTLLPFLVNLLPLPSLFRCSCIQSTYSVLPIRQCVVDCTWVCLRWFQTSLCRLSIGKWLNKWTQLWYFKLSIILLQPSPNPCCKRTAIKVTDL